MSEKRPNVKLRPDGRWEARAQYRKKRLSAYGKSPDEAVSELNRKLKKRSQELHSVRPQVSADTSLSRYWEEVYLPTISNRSKGWKRQNEWARKKLDCTARQADLSDSIAMKPLKEVTRHDLQLIFNQLRIDPTHPHWIGHVSLKHLKSILFGLFSLALADDLIAKNPCERLKLPSPTEEEMQRTAEWLTPEELAALLVKAKGRRTIGPLVLTGLMGLGFEEIRELTTEKISATQLGPVGTKNRNRPRVLPLHPWVAELLIEQGFPLIGKSDSQVSRDLGLLAKRSVGRNTLRHTCASGLLLVDCPERVSHHILGHKAKTIHERYTHVADELVKKYLFAWIEHVQRIAVRLSTCQSGVIDGVSS